MGKPTPKRPHSPKPKVHDLRGHYAGVPKDARIAVLDVDNPFPDHHATATLAQPPAGARTMDGPPTWHVPPQAKIKIIAATRSDVPALLFARHQIDRACFLAARAYAQLLETVDAVRLKSVDVSAPHVSGTRYDTAYESIAARRGAAKQLRSVERTLAKRYGAEGLMLTRDILGAGRTIETAARERGVADKQNLRWLGGLLRRCLRLLACLLGFASWGAYDEHRRRRQLKAA